MKLKIRSKYFSYNSLKALEFFLDRSRIAYSSRISASLIGKGLGLMVKGPDLKNAILYHSILATNLQCEARHKVTKNKGPVPGLRIHFNKYTQFGEFGRRESNNIYSQIQSKD